MLKHMNLIISFPFTTAMFTLSYDRLCKPCNGYDMKQVAWQFFPVAMHQFSQVRFTVPAQYAHLLSSPYYLLHVFFRTLQFSLLHLIIIIICCFCNARLPTHWVLKGLLCDSCSAHIGNQTRGSQAGFVHTTRDQNYWSEVWNWIS